MRPFGSKNHSLGPKGDAFTKRSDYKNHKKKPPDNDAGSFFC